MEPIIIMQAQWGENLLVPLYLFFGGITAGAFLIAVIADFLSKKNKEWLSLSVTAAFAAVPFYALSGIFITAHLGKPLRGLFFPFFFTNYNSWMTLGGLAMGLAAPIVVIYAASHFLNLDFKYSETARRLSGKIGVFISKDRFRQTLGIVGIPVVIWMAVNTAMLLAGAMFVPLWSMTYLPWLFVNSGILTGLAGVGLIYILVRKFWLVVEDDGIRKIIHVFTYGVIIFELTEMLILYVYLNFLNAPPTKAVALGEFVVPDGTKLAYDYVVTGELSGWFWVGVILIGLAIPFLLSIFSLIVRRWELSIASTKFALIVVGGVILRLVIVWGGDLSAPLSFPPVNFPISLLGG